MLQLIAPAKLNLCLDILEKDSSGYHKIQTILHASDQIHNKIEIRPSQQDLDQSRKFSQENQLVKSAYQLIKSHFKIQKHAQIEIQRHIPYSSGLGGESSNAATILRGLCQLWDLPQDQLPALAATLGMDAPFFLYGGTALATNYGEQITPLPPLTGLTFNIQAKSSPQKDKTAQAFQQLDLSLCGQNQAKTQACLAAIKAQNPHEIIKNLHNDFETLSPVSPAHHLSGSGPSVFQVSVNIPQV